MFRETEETATSHDPALSVIKPGGHGTKDKTRILPGNRLALSVGCGLEAILHGAWRFLSFLMSCHVM